MNESILIHTERRLLPRLLDVALTLMAWIAFTALVYQGLIAHLISSETVSWPIITSALRLVILYFLLTTMDGVLLVLWSRYNKMRARYHAYKTTSALARTELARSLNIKPGVIDSMFRANHLTVYHAKTGEIENIHLAG